MPTARNGDVALHYEVDGDGRDGEAVAFVSDVGCGAWLWGWQAPALAGPHRTVVWDARGTGRSDAPPGPYTAAGMAGDLEAVLADAGVRSATLVGAGLGGMVALAYALEYGRADRLALLGTAAAGEAMDARAMVGDPRESLEAALSGSFRRDHPEAVERIAAWRREEDARGAAARAHVAAVEAFDERDRLHEVLQPALVIHGEADGIVPAAAGEALAGDLPRGRFDGHPGGGHLVLVERARLVTDAIEGFIAGTAG